jgi:hypothetical protein
VSGIIACATKGRKIAGLLETRDRYQRGKLYPIHTAIPGGVINSRTKMPKRPTSAGNNR